MTTYPGRSLVAVFVLIALSGCIARTAASVVTAPVRVASKGVDLATTSQSEADERRGRDVRHREERLDKLDRQYRRHSQQCRQGDTNACREAEREYAEIQRLSTAIPTRR
jgi:hypothetical protein